MTPTEQEIHELRAALDRSSKFARIAHDEHIKERQRDQQALREAYREIDQLRARLGDETHTKA